MFKTIHGCTVRYELKANAQSDALPVLFLHGWGCDVDIFHGLMDAVEGEATLAALDFPAHGESGDPPQPWGVEDFAELVRELLESVNIQKADIVAHSFGARVAIYLAAKYPQMVNKIVITGGAGVKKPADAQASQKTKRYKRLSGAVRALMKFPPLTKPMKALQEMLIQKYGSRDYAALSESMRPTFVKIISEDLTPMLSQIKAPVLLIWGSNDTETPLWMAQTMEREIVDAGLVVFEGRTHFAFLEESARFATIVKQFFWGGAKA
ncbi:MAG TPA: alpha/beta hydrolase [Candidatus Limiplasma sp.]|nr:alpha/beta hydrolase [Candidatus Limiplasma sp.]HRX08792.1 alpha/beta hydrolase [Candidatus Limiplasma sp.]